MRRVRLTTIGLDHDGKAFPEGAELIVGEDIDEATAAARVAAGSAEVIDDEGLSFAFSTLLEATTSAAAAYDAAWVALIDAVGSDAEAAAVLLAGRARMDSASEAVRERTRAVFDRAEAELARREQSQAPQPPQGGVEPTSPEEGAQSGGETGADAPSPEVAGEGEPPATDASDPVEPGSTNDSPPEEGAVTGEPAAASTAAGEPDAEPKQPPKPKRAPARGAKAPAKSKRG